MGILKNFNTFHTSLIFRSLVYIDLEFITATTSLYYLIIKMRSQSSKSFLKRTNCVAALCLFLWKDTKLWK